MPKFLLKASYTADGIKGLLKVGGTNRRQAIENMLKDLGGRIEAFYYAFGDADIYSIGEVPDTVSIAALALTINACGLVTTSITILLAPEDIDKAVRVSVNYRMPGN
jgi:uncharacterized protein with GYD domain